MNQVIEIPAEPIIFSRKQEVIDESVKRATKGALAINHFIQIFNSLNIGSLSLDDFSAIQHGLEKFIRNRIAESVPMPQMGGLAISREKFLAMLDIPDLAELRLALNQADGFIPPAPHGITLRDGVAEVDQAWLQELTDRQTQSLTTDEEKEGYLLTQRILKDIDTMYDRFGIKLLEGGFPLIRQSTWHRLSTEPVTTTRIDSEGRYLSELRDGIMRRKRGF